MLLIHRQRQLLKSIPRLYSTNLYNSNFSFSNNWSEDNKKEFIDSFLIYNDFITKQEEEQFMSEVEPHLKRHIYEKDHWDDVSVNISCPTLQYGIFRQYKDLEKQKGNILTSQTQK